MSPPFTPPFSTLESFQDLCDHLTEEGIEHSVESGPQIAVITELEVPLASPVYVRWDGPTGLVQIIHPVVLGIAPERFLAVEHALAALNHASPLPGLGLDPDRRFAYFRLAVQRDELDRITVPALHRAVLAAVASARALAPAVYEVAYAGALTNVPLAA